jgi:hypothetical protein
MERDAHLHGRIVALELLVRSLMTVMVMEGGNGTVFVGKMRDEMLASLQLIQRDLGEYEDDVWGEAADALRSQFFELGKRIAYLRGEEPPTR